MTSRAALACSPLAWETSLAPFRICAAAWTICAAPLACSAVLMAISRALALAVLMESLTFLTATICSSEARLICDTSDELSVTPLRMVFKPGQSRFRKPIAFLGDAGAGIGGLGRFAGRVFQSAHDLGDFRRRFGAAVRQISNFLGHHRESAPGFARARRFDGGVQRKQIGALGDDLDRADDSGDVARPFVQFAHDRGGLGHRAGDLARCLRWIFESSGRLPPPGATRDGQFPRCV